MTPQKNLISSHIFDRELHEIYARLGEVVLVPIGNDDNVIAQPKSIAETQNADYLRRLAESNVGVALGPVSGGLYAVALHTVDAAAAFVRDNPFASETARIDLPVATVCFFQIDGFAPRTTTWPGGEWLGAGRCVPVRAKSQLVAPPIWTKDAAPARIRFEDLIWSQEVQSLFTPSITEARYGKPFLPWRNGRRDVNFAYWASYFAAENRIRYSQEADEFYYFDSESIAWKGLLRLTLEAHVLDFLVAQSRKPGSEPLNRLDARGRRKLIAEMKVVALCKIPGLVNNLVEFVGEYIERHDGSSITIAELYAAYGQFCNAHQASKLSEREFQNRIAVVIESLFKIRRSHSIQRANGNQRGFRNLRLRFSVYRTNGVSSAGKARSPGFGNVQRQAML